MKHLKRKEFYSVIKLLSFFNKNESEVRDIAATDLYFLYFTERNVNLAEDYADSAVKTNPYNAKALVNKGNSFLIKSDFTSSKEIYLQAIGIHADCVQSIYNLELENLRLDVPEEASQASEKLLKVIPKDIFVIYQISNLYE